MSNSLKRIGFFKNKAQHPNMDGIDSPTFNVTETVSNTIVTYDIDTNKPNATIYFSAQGTIVGNDFTDSALTGNISLDANGNASLVRTISSNNIGQSKSFNVSIRTNSVTGNAVYTGNTISVIDNIPISSNNTNYFNSTIIANVTIGSDLYRIQQYSVNSTINVTPGSGKHDANIGVIAVGGGGGGGYGTFGTSGGGGGGGGGVYFANLTLDANLTTSVVANIGSAGAVATNGGNTTIDLWSIDANGGLLGESTSGASVRAGDGGDTEYGNILSGGGGSGGLSTANVTFPFGHGGNRPNFGYAQNGYLHEGFRYFVYENRNYTPVTQSSVTPPGGSGAIFNVWVNIIKDTDANANAATFEGLFLTTDGYGAPNKGSGYNVGDVIVIDGADLGGTSGINDLSYTVGNVDAGGGLVGMPGFPTFLMSEPQNYDVDSVSGFTSPFDFNYVDPNSTGHDSIGSNTQNMYFGGGGGSSQNNLNGGITHTGVGYQGSGGKGEHFRNTGSNPDMFPTAGISGAVLLRYRVFDEYRSLELS